MFRGVSIFSLSHARDMWNVVNVPSFLNHRITYHSLILASWTLFYVVIALPVSNLKYLREIHAGQDS